MFSAITKKIKGDSGTIDYEEFIAATINLNRLEQEAAYQQAFQTFDTDNSGCLSVDEINNALKVGMTAILSLTPIQVCPSLSSVQHRISSLSGIGLDIALYWAIVYASL